MTLKSKQYRDKIVPKMGVQETFGENGQCSICKLSDIDKLNYGEIHAVKDYKVHLFCLYFSTDLPQNGKDTAGIVGFEIRDIRKYIKERDGKECVYCKKKSATIRCQHPECGRVFHQVCGFKANARFEYLEEFKAFCDKHNQIEGENLEYPEVVGCLICYEHLGDFHPVTTVPSCCGFWFHQQCLRQYAINAGFSFMCPACRNKKYDVIARRHGIYVPEYEALWEKSHNYADIERFYTRCDAINCICPNGRTYRNHKWELQLCTCCGSFGYHILCRPESKRNEVIVCNACSKPGIKWKTTDPENEIFTAPLSQSVLNGDSEGERKDAAGAVVVQTIDLTNDDDIRKQSVVTGVRADVKEIAGEVKFRVENGITEIVFTYEDSVSRKDETIQQKRDREKAARPLRDELRDFRINLLFRDNKRKRLSE